MGSESPLQGVTLQGLCFGHQFLALHLEQAVKYTVTGFSLQSLTSWGRACLLVCRGSCNLLFVFLGVLVYLPIPNEMCLHSTIVFSFFWVLMVLFQPGTPKQKIMSWTLKDAFLHWRMLWNCLAFQLIIWRVGKVIHWSTTKMLLRPE